MERDSGAGGGVVGEGGRGIEGSRGRSWGGGQKGAKEDLERNRIGQ